MKGNPNHGRSSSLPWWTWVLPFFIANLGTWLSLWFKTDPGASLWYLPTAFGIVMAYWWGPRVLLGVYLNAVLCAPLWDLPWQGSFLYALPETIEVGLSWLFFIKIAQGKCWLPDLKNVGRFLLLGSILPTIIANAYLVAQLYLLGNIVQAAIRDNWRILFSADLATQFVIAVPLLVLFTRPMREKGWTQTQETIPQLPLLPDNRNSRLDMIFIIAILGTALITVLTFSIQDLWLLYGFLMILIAIRYGVNMTVIGTNWIGLLAFLVPAILTQKLGLTTATYGDFVSTNFNILFLCGVTLLTGRAISDLSTVITERGHMEAELRDSEELYRVTLSNISDAVFVTDDNGNFVYICSNVNLIFSYSHAEVAAFAHIGKLLGDNLFDSEELDTRREIQNIERQISTKAGDQRVLLVNVKRVSIRGGTVLYTCRDITDRKRIEGVLEERQHLLQKILDTEPGTVYIYDLEERRNVYVNRHWLSAFGYTAEETQAMGDELSIRIFHPDDLPLIAEHHARWQQARDGETRTIEYRVLSKAGEWRWLHSREALFMRNGSGRVLQILGIAHDVTEQIQMQKAVLKERDFSDAMLNSLPGVFYFFDQTGKYLRWNKNFETASGYSAEEIAQRHPLDYFGGEEKNYVAQKIKEVFEFGEADAEASFVPKNGKLIPYYFTGKRIEIENASYLIGMGIDITRRKQAEEELAKRAEQMRALASYVESVREDERTRIAREIHDEFGQFLTALKMDLAWVSRRLPSGDEKRERLNQASSLVDENVRRVQRIATELRPGLLDDLGLMTALEWQAHEFSKHTGLLCQLNLPKYELRLNPSLNTTLFRIFQETLTNVARHARATRVEVRLQKLDQNVLLSIEDNGRGITDLELNDPHSLGLLGLHERAAQWDGKLSIRGEAGKGTTVIVRIPLSLSGKGGGT